MKISKLFHWLYAILMMLPVFALGSTILVNTFNKNTSTHEESVINYEYGTNSVSSLNDLVVGRAYHFDSDNFTFDTSDDDFVFNGIILKIYYFGGFEADIDYVYITELVDVDKMANIQVSSNGSLWLYFPYNLYSDELADFVIDRGDDFRLVFDFVLVDIQGIETTLDYNYEAFEPCTSIPISSVSSELVEDTISDVFYYALDKVQTSPVFSWAYNSFLVAPFQYIMALFGMPSTHIVVELLSYWLAISLIWLVFDLIMYVPLLVHRWLDKGVLE